MQLIAAKHSVSAVVKVDIIVQVTLKNSGYLPL